MVWVWCLEKTNFIRFYSAERKRTKTKYFSLNKVKRKRSKEKKECFDFFNKFSVIYILSLTENENSTSVCHVIYLFTHSYEVEWIKFMLLIMMLSYFGMVHVRKEKSKRKDENDALVVDKFFLLLLSFIRRKSCLLMRWSSACSRVLFLRRLGKAERKKLWDARAGARTLDIVVKSHTLYRLSYPGDVNTRIKLSNILVFVFSN